jgi:hypothetical protein
MQESYGTMRAAAAHHPLPSSGAEGYERRLGLMRIARAAGLGCAALLALGAASTATHVHRIERAGWIDSDAGPPVRREGSNAWYGMPTYDSAVMNAKEEETGFGVPGQLGMGPDYYSTASWDNAQIHPSLMTTQFDPYMGQGGCPGCKMTRKTYMFSVDPRCDGSYQCRNIRKILKLDEWSKEAAFQAAKYKEKTWIGNQAGFFIGEAKDVVMVVPPCFLPLLANAELNALNDAIYDMGGSILVLGGLTGANFISQNLRGLDGRGYVDTIGDRPKFSLDAVWSGGPFVMQKAAADTEFFYGPRYLEGTESTWGIPASELPPETIHYYMSAEQVSVVFEIPAGTGRILFMGYDFGYMAPRWMEALMLARRELQIQREHHAWSSHQVIVLRQQPEKAREQRRESVGVERSGGGSTAMRTRKDRAARQSRQAHDAPAQVGRRRVEELLPVGADGDALDLEIAQAVDKLEAKSEAHVIAPKTKAKD